MSVVVHTVIVGREEDRAKRENRAESGKLNLIASLYDPLAGITRYNTAGEKRQEPFL